MLEVGVEDGLDAAHHSMTNTAVNTERGKDRPVPSVETGFRLWDPTDKQPRRNRVPNGNEKESLRQESVQTLDQSSKDSS
jgi:hypothetical protein